MADEQVPSCSVSDTEEDEKTQYKPPPEKSLAEIMSQDTEDESLRKYKETLLGTSSGIGAPFIIGNYMCI